MYHRFYKIVRLLKKELPAAYPVKIRRKKLDNLDGYCERDGNSFIIGIHRDLCEDRAIDTLLHEWAHARSWDHLMDKLEGKDFHRKSHDASWGVAYSEVYRIYESSICHND